MNPRPLFCIALGLALVAFYFWVPAAALNEMPVYEIQGESPIQAMLTSTDSDQLFTTAFQTAYTAAGGANIDFTTIRGMWCTIENASVRVAYGQPASQSAPLGDIVNAGSNFCLQSTSIIQATHFISMTASTPANLMCTIWY
ncbi:MAG: hypothetical protein ACLPQX_05560 [Syntrophobacteraceae bacterium]